MIIRSRILACLLGLFTVLLLAISGSLPMPLLDGVDGSRVLAQDQVSEDATIANCRYGVTPLSEQQMKAVSTLGAGWLLDFSSFPPENRPTNDAEYVHMVMVYEDKILIQPDPAKRCDCPDDYRYLGTYQTVPSLDARLANYLRNHPGETYIAGNEVERYGQGETHPEAFADAYHEIYTFIKSHDPTAQVAISALVQFTPNRQQYLEKVWASYLKKYGSHMPIDVWTMHIYVLPELRFDTASKKWVPNGIASTGLGTDVGLGKRESLGDPSQCSNPDVYCVAEHDDMRVFEEQVLAMRKWMKQNGQQNKPLLLSEYSVLYPYETFPDGSCDWLKDEYGKCFTPSRVTGFMNASFDYLNNARSADLGYPLDNNRLIQQWMWFSVYNDFLGRASNLVTSDASTTLTTMGNNFKNRVAAETLYKNLIANKAADVIKATNGANTTTARISVTFANNGNEAIRTPFKVSFYRKPDFSGLIGSVNVNYTTQGCASHLYKAELAWKDLKQGTYRYYVKIDSDNAIVEVPGNDSDNVASGTVRIVSNDIKLPIIRRN